MLHVCYCCMYVIVTCTLHLFSLSSVYLIDIWNVIEAFRENSLNNHDLLSEVHVTTLESVLSTIFCALNKRLPNSSQIDVDESIGLLYSWLLSTYDMWVRLRNCYRRENRELCSVLVQVWGSRLLVLCCGCALSAFMCRWRKDWTARNDDAVPNNDWRMSHAVKSGIFGSVNLLKAEHLIEKNSVGQSINQSVSVLILLQCVICSSINLEEFN